MFKAVLDERFARPLLWWGRRHRTLAASAIYGTIAAASLAGAYLVRFEFDPAALRRVDFLASLPLLVLLRLGISYGFKLPMGRWRYVGSRDFVRLLAAQTVGSVAFLMVSWMIAGIPNVPRSVVVVEWVMSSYVTMMTWVSYRLAFERSRVQRALDVKRVLVVGAGEGGEVLVSGMLRSSAGYLPVAFVDDDPLKWGTSIHGVKVFGPTSRISEVVSELEIDEVVIAIPSAHSAAIRRIVESCESLTTTLKILPGIDEVLQGRVSMRHVREVRVEDLLGRDPISLELPELAEQLAGQTVMVTGAAGSIGSELVRQISLHSPRRLVLLDQAETPLYYLQRELLDRELPFDLDVVVGSVTDTDTVRRVMRDHRPDRVFHAAAYKHVPLMETNRLEAIRTNVLGTHLVASEAAEAGAQAFILVSTDKAVRPKNVMGATKQAAERVVLSLQGIHPECTFGVVRFGNVLGSNGSVVPIFRKQLAEGRPLTVTDEEVTRYFMTIPEAVQLILQASLLPELRGHVAMLDMGEPVRIIDLARDLLRLSGKPFRVGETVVITGLRPGEKLHEELADPSEAVLETALPRVSIIRMNNGFAHLSGELTASLRRQDLSCLERHVLAPLGRRPRPAVASGVEG